jgi:hypothetical protein
VLKKIRRMLALQALLLGIASWFGWKNREAIERAARAAKAAWDAPKDGADVAAEDVTVAVLVNERERVSAPLVATPAAAPLSPPAADPASF